MAHLTVISFGPDEAEEFGKLRSELRKLGRPIPQIDIQIGATARAGGFIVATADEHFRSVPGLVLEDWTKPADHTESGI